jgi:hypothetical protein
MKAGEPRDERDDGYMEVALPTSRDKVSVVVAVAREAVRCHAANPLSWLRLGEALLMSNETGEAVAILQEGLSRHPDHRDLAMATAEAYFQSGDVGGTLEVLVHHLQRSPGDLRARLRWFELLLASGRRDEAIRAATQRQAGDAEQLLAAGLLDAGTRYRLALALAVSGRETEAATMLSMAEVVSVNELACPAQFRSDAEFRGELRREILANGSLTADPPGKSTRGGMQTRDLMKPATPALASLVAAVEAQVHTYDQHNAALRGTRPARTQMNAWAVVYGQTGFQTSHIHPQGWISGVYYVGPESGEAGALKLGALPESYGIAPPWGVMRIAPRPSRLVLFPSWVPHSTEHAGRNEGRISVAFDLVPLP